MLASDVEYRIHQILEEAAKFMRHGKRTTLSTADIDQALRILNIEPLYGHNSHHPPTFRRALPLSGSVSTSSVYFVEDEEIDFDRILRDEKIILPKGVSWSAHWLAVEGVQPLIPENPAVMQREVVEDAPNMNGILPLTSQQNMPSAGRPGAPNSSQPQQQQQQLVKQVLSRELQLYYARLTTSLVPPGDSSKRTAALASLRHDAGLQALLPYLIRWVGEGVVTALKEGSQTDTDGKTMQVYLDVISALLENMTLFVEPYLHQLLPPLLSLLLHSSLPLSHSAHLRTTAAQTLSSLLRKHSTTYPSLSPRIMKTLLLALVSPGKTFGTREGAVRGLVGVGKEAIRKGLIDGGGAKVIGSEYAGNAGNKEARALMQSVMEAFSLLHTPSDMQVSLDPSNNAEDATLMGKMEDIVGPEFARRLSGDAAWAQGLIRGQVDL
jgi:transcription initiation factor TFIID subunit 6